MRPTKTLLALASGMLLAASQAHAVTITFENLAVGTTLSNQYAALGVVFTPNAFSGAGAPSGNWATNTDMTIVSSSGGDVGGLGAPSLVSGNILRSFGGWLNENGDPSFLMTFSTPITAISVDFAGVSDFANSTLIAFAGASQVGMVAGTTAGQFTLSLVGAGITSVAVTPGFFSDWVGIDNINFTPSVVPEPGTYAMMGLGIALLALKRRRSA